MVSETSPPLFTGPNLAQFMETRNLRQARASGGHGSGGQGLPRQAGNDPLHQHQGPASHAGEDSSGRHLAERTI